MKNNKIKRTKIIVVLLLLLLTTGCTKTLTDSNKKAIKNPATGQTLTENIICKPTNKNTAKLYKKYNVNIDSLPECKDYKINTGKYEGVWNSLFVKPLAFVLITLGRKIGNYGVSIIIISLLIRLIAFPITRKTALQSELMKKAQPELNRLQKKYANKQDQESMIKQNQEMMAIYKKYNISPLSGCLFSFLQFPIFIAFYEAVQRTPVLFEDKFLGLHLGTTPFVGMTSSTVSAIVYVGLLLLVAASTYFTFKLNTTGNMEDPTMKMMPTMMSGMILMTAGFVPSGLGIYWVTSNIFTIIQNILVKRSKDVYGKE